VASSEIHLRPYQPADFETLYRIDQACFPKGIAYGRTELQIYLRTEASHCLLAETSGIVAGYILTDRSADVGHIVTLDVLEPYRRQNVGSLLLEAAEQEAASQSVQRIYLETATTNKPAIAFWKKHGYREVAVVENYYGRGLDAFEMQKLLERKSPVKVLR
jgi:[ribosomal protein S18]-alanine N-acetyltransferase